MESGKRRKRPNEANEEDERKGKSIKVNTTPMSTTASYVTLFQLSNDDMELLNIFSNILKKNQNSNHFEMILNDANLRERFFLALNKIASIPKEIKEGEEKLYLYHLPFETPPIIGIGERSLDSLCKNLQNLGLLSAEYKLGEQTKKMDITSLFPNTMVQLVEVIKIQQREIQKLTSKVTSQGKQISDLENLVKQLIQSKKSGDQKEPEKTTPGLFR